MRSFIAVVIIALLALPQSAEAVRLKELVDVEGFRTNPITGVGLVVGLAGTGDDYASIVTRKPLATLLRHLGANINPDDVRVRNVAIVMVTANLPAFGRPGMKVDVTVSAIGTARSLQGGTLILTPLKGADKDTYALAQGPLQVGGYSASGVTGSAVSKNHVNVGRIPGGGIIEKEVASSMPTEQLVLQIREPDFTTASRIAVVVNKALGEGSAKVTDPSTVLVKPSEEWKDRFVDLMALLEALDANPDVPARVIIDERTGTIVIGASVTLGPAAIASGGLTINVIERQDVYQPNAFGQGTTTTVPESQVEITERDGKLQTVPEATTVGDVAAALNTLGVKPRDLVTIFHALKAAGALRAEIQVL